MRNHAINPAISSQTKQSLFNLVKRTPEGPRIICQDLTFNQATGVTTSPHKKVKKKLDSFFWSQNRNYATPAYCPVYWHAKKPTADFSGYDEFCVKKPLLSALWRSPEAEKTNDIMSLSQTYSISVDGQSQ